ncbi:TonB-dependent receptor plug domain-containing protein [Halomonas llamarensis]|uniref:TonB-dependent receptor n=1 Tax=Halomonas llamarensis TaxID=2945104 RepID=A0ABT0SV17_9GAMM|nr:TonB-dependent receptor [Halomonas llamarensis]MCL7931668.1 TonB-dependent receptor [Halomonas llamarensis]
MILTQHRFFSYRASTLWLWMATLVALPVAAQDEQYADTKSEKLPVLLVEGDLIQGVEGKEALEARRQSTNSKIVINEEMFEDYADSSVGDLLRRVPGAFMEGAKGEKVNLRGLDEEFTQVQIDGLRLPGGSERAIEIGRFPASMVEEIEIIRSPRADQTGQGINGTVNVKLKGAPSEQIGRVTVGAGHVSDNGRDVGGGEGNGSFTYGDKVGDFGYLISASARERRKPEVEDKRKRKFKDGFFDELELEQKEKATTFSEHDVIARFQWDITPTTTFKLQPSFFFSEEEKIENEKKRKFTDAQGQNLKETELKDKNETKDQDQSRVRAVWEREISENESLKTSLTYQKTEENKIKTELVDKFDASGALDKSETKNEIEKVESEEWRASAEYKLAVSDRHDLKVGGEFVSKDTFGNVAESKDDDPLEIKPEKTFGVDEDRFMLFVQDDYSLSDRTDLGLGIRGEYNDLIGKPVAGNGETAADSELVWLPSFQIKHQYNEQTDLRLGISRTILRPAFEDLTTTVKGGDGDFDDPDKTGNPGLEPEKAWGLDFGGDYYFADGSGVMGLNFFWREFEDKIQSQRVRNPNNGRVERSPVNAGGAFLRGVEFDYRRNMSSFGLRNLELIGNFTLADTELDKTGKPLEKTVEFFSDLGFEYTLPGWNASYGVTWSYTGKSDSSKLEGVETEDETADAFSTVDAFVRAEVYDGWTVTLSGQNLFEGEEDETKRKVKPGEIEFEDKTKSFSRLIQLSVSAEF